MLVRRAVRASGAGAFARGGARVLASSGRRPSHARSDVSLLGGVAAGGVAGVLSALSGVGGGMILVPAVAKMSAMPMQVINGTCYAALTVTAGVGAWNYAGAGACNYAMAALTALPAMAFAGSGVRLAQRLSSQRLSTIVGAGMLASVPFVVLKGTDLAEKLPFIVHKADGKARDPLDLQDFGSPSPASDAASKERVLTSLKEEPGQLALANWKYAAVGAFSGFISGLCGVGGSLITTTYLTTATDMPQREIVGTTLISMLPMALTTNVHNYRAGAVHFPTAVRVGASLVAAMHVTSQFVLTHPVPEAFLRDVLAAMVGAGAIAMIRRV